MGRPIQGQAVMLVRSMVWSHGGLVGQVTDSALHCLQQGETAACTTADVCSLQKYDPSLAEKNKL